MQAFITFLGVCLFAAVAYRDIRTRRIPNEFIVAILALAAFRIALSGDPIAGLYTCGEMVGGLFHHNYPGGSGLMSGAVFGRIAGANAARDRS